MTYENEELIEVSYWTLLFATLPLLGLIWVSSYLKIGLENAMMIGTIRTLIQLSILGIILEPIFIRGKEMWGLVLAYVLFMVTLASYESTVRSRYYFKDMFWYILAMFLVNVSVVSLFAFGLLLNLDPLWDPQYVIPIVGMLLGNCINGVSLCVNALLTSIVESSREVELLLSFGASPNEATQRNIREAIRTGSLPRLNGMAIIGLISIPGMMTGQILGGSSVTQAARYQILITYLIAISSFGTIFSECYLAIRMCFDSQQMLRTDWLMKRSGKKSFLAAILEFVQGCFIAPPTEHVDVDGSLGEISTLASVGSLSIKTPPKKSGGSNVVEVSGLSFAFVKRKNSTSAQRRILFQDLDFQLGSGAQALVDGPSGAGKSTLFRIIAGLLPSTEGSVSLFGKPQSSFQDMSLWRKKVLYVPQTKVDMVGSPKDLIATISEFRVWKMSEMDAPILQDMIDEVEYLIEVWGVRRMLLESEWKELSGGESQRVLLAIALASRPEVILLDESTSALDLATKHKIETSIHDYCEEKGMIAIWITHDQGQQRRIAQRVHEGSSDATIV